MAQAQQEGKEASGGPLGNIVWKAMSIGSTLVATKFATTVASATWKLVTGRSVPVKGDYDRERTRDVVAYTALSAMVLAGTKVAAERKAAEYYRDSTGHLPKHLVETKLSRKEKKNRKRLEKASQQAAERCGRPAS